MAVKKENTIANAEFEKERNAGLQLNQLSYICDYCGKVNQIGATRCTRCGKRRPRSEYVNALNKVSNAKTVKQEYFEEQGKIEAQQKDVAQQQLVRLVETRVAEEKQHILAQESNRVEQETDAIKKSTARDAVLRIIASEKVAEERVQQAERKADDVLKSRDSQIDGIIEQERNKILEVAAQKIVASRAGIEEAAREQIEANKKIANQFINDTLDAERDKAEKNAARRAVLQIIAAEKAAEDRIRAEREEFRQQLTNRQNSMPSSNVGNQYNANNGGATQPFTIVPYVNAQQPLYQYRPNQVYKFVPNSGNAQNGGMAVCPPNYQAPVADTGKKNKKK